MRNKAHSKRNAKLPHRSYDNLTPQTESYLIVSEGSKTEPCYFQGLAQHIHMTYGGGIKVKPVIEAKGEGKSTTRLVEETARIVAKAPIHYNHVWVVFDKDDFQDFDEAINLAMSYGFNVAWSNPCFEYWIYLNFSYSTGAHRSDVWEKKVDDIFKKRKISKKGYEKKDPAIFSKLMKHGCLNTAINYAEQAMKCHDASSPPSLKNPSTTVHELILELKPYLEDLLD